MIYFWKFFLYISSLIILSFVESGDLSNLNSKFCTAHAIPYSEDSPRDTVLFNNKEILIGGKPFFNKEWFCKGICEIQDLLDDNGRFLSFSDFQVKCRLTRTNFLRFYQVIDAIPKYLLLKSRTLYSSVLTNFEDPSSFLLVNGVESNGQNQVTSIGFLLTRRTLLNKLARKDGISQ